MILDKEKIKELLPHREPILLVDQAEIIDEARIESVFTADPAMDIFRGHFPDYPVLPGAYLIESLAQTADLLLLSRPEYAGTLPLFSSVSAMRFIRPVRPGETIAMCAEMLPDAPEGFCEFSVRANVEGKTAARGRLTIACRKMPEES